MANAVLALLLARALFGSVVGLLAAVSPYLNGLGTTLFLDGTETTFVLASLLALAAAYRTGSWRRHALAGALRGLAFLTKESALLLAPPPRARP